MTKRPTDSGLQVDPSEGQVEDRQGELQTFAMIKTRANEIKHLKAGRVHKY